MRTCHICGNTRWIERHHVFGGANRKKSDAFDMVADRCHFCHNEPPNGVHHNRENRLKLQAEFQARFEEEHTREEFIQIFGRSYL